VPDAKDIDYFTRHYHKGEAWYRQFFSDSKDAQVTGELSHNYLFSKKAAYRIKKDLGDDITLLVCLREPADRAFSAYLYLKKHGLYEGTFKSAVVDVPELINHGRYGIHLRTYLDKFNKNNICILVFDDLKSNPNSFAQKVFKYLNVRQDSLPEHLCEKSLPAAAPRSLLLSRVLKKIAILLRKYGWMNTLGQLKSSDVIKQILYKPYKSNDKPSPNSETVRYVRDKLKDDVRVVDNLFDTSLIERWGY
jgi:hypothetical protein